jgi:hypothetical protein
MWHVVIPGGVGVAGWALLAFACAVRSLALELVAIFMYILPVSLQMKREKEILNK